MSQEQFDQIVEAILAGKYSWACVLILQAAGYNPLHYIPYRTYNRLIKDNRISHSSGTKPKQRKQSSCRIRDLNSLKELKPSEAHLQGGMSYCIYEYLFG